MPDLFDHRHIDRKESDVTPRWKLFPFPGLPGLENVFLPQLAGVVHFRKRERVAVPAELVACRFFAALWGFAVHFLDRHRVGGHGVFAPDVGFALVHQIDLECPVGFDCPNGAERICPSAHQRGLTALLEHCASTEQRDCSDSQKN